MTMFQHTLASSASLSGASLHTGEQVTLTLRPAPLGYGRKFRRMDLPEQPLIDAAVAHVKTVERATTLGEGSLKVHTVEHILSALSGLGVDNALIEMTANEPPIGDGSAAPFVELIQKAGIQAQEAPRPDFEVSEPIHVEPAGDSLMTLFPHHGLRSSCTHVGPGGHFLPYFSTEITLEIYAK